MSSKKRNRKPRRQSSVAVGRRVAFDVLLAVAESNAHSDELLRTRVVNKLEPADRNLATALVLGVLRWQLRLDQQVAQHLTKPNAKLDEPIRIALRLGAFQLLHMSRIPARAAIDESVELTKEAGHRFASGLVNAVLRKLAGAIEAKQQAAQQDDAEKLVADAGEVAAAAHPQWLVERWRKHYGAALAAELCMHGQLPPRIHLRLSGPEVAEELTAAGMELEPAVLLAEAYAVKAGDATTTEAFKSGRCRLQDEGSQLVAELAAAVADRFDPVERILDCCAAPGGKTLILAERHPAAQIMACESSEARAGQMAKRLKGLGSTIAVRHADASQLAERDVFDLALCDVPCSGTGTLGRNPEIRYRLAEIDLGRQAERQRAILAAALRAVRPGGRVLYSTCSLEAEENEQVVESVVAEFGGAVVSSLATRLRMLQAAGVLTEHGLALAEQSLTAEGYLRLLPGRLATDGFFMALIERR